MLATVDLDDKTKMMAGEIREVRTDRGLTPEMMLLEWWLPQMPPQPFFGFGRVTAQGSRARHTRIYWTRRSL
jgi:hypothetical protein